MDRTRQLEIDAYPTSTDVSVRLKLDLIAADCNDLPRACPGLRYCRFPKKVSTKRAFCQKTRWIQSKSRLHRPCGSGVSQPLSNGMRFSPRKLDCLPRSSSICVACSPRLSSRVAVAFGAMAFSYCRFCSWAGWPSVSLWSRGGEARPPVTSAHSSWSFISRPSGPTSPFSLRYTSARPTRMGRSARTHARETFRESRTPVLDPTRTGRSRWR